MTEASSTTASKEKFLVVPIIVLILAQMGTTGENSAMSLSATALVNMFGATTADFQLANMIYSLVAGALMIAGGMMGVIIGWKKNFRIGVVLCALGEVVVALAPNMMILTWVGRSMVGLGASFMIPSVLGLIPCIYHSGKNRAIAFGAIGAASGLATILPILFGVLLDSLGFRITFGVLAVYFLIVFAASFALPPIAKTSGNLKFDYVGTGLAALGLFLFLVGISRFSVWGIVEALPGAPFTIMGLSPAPFLAVAGIIVLAIMIVAEKRIEAKNGCALIPQSFYKTPQVLAGLLACFMIFFASAIITLIIVPYLQRVAGWSATQGAVIAVVVGIPMFLLALGIPKLLPNLHPRTTLQAGYLCIGVGIVAIIFSFTAEGVLPFMWLGVLLVGLGEGCLSAQASNVVALAVDDRDASQSGGVQATSRNVGYAVAIAVMGTVLLFGINSGMSSAIQQDTALPAETRTALSAQNFDMMSNDDFAATIAEAGATAEEAPELVGAYAESRTNAVRLSLGVGAAAVLLSLLSTRAVTVARKEESAS